MPKVQEINSHSDMKRFTMEGILHKKFEPVNITDKFSKQEFILHVQGSMEQHYKFMCVNTRIPQLLKVEEGDAVEVSFNLYGKMFAVSEDQGGGYSFGPLVGQVYEINIIK